MNYPVSFVFLLFSLFSAASFPVFVIFCFSAFSDEAARPLLGPGHPPVHSAYWFLYGLPGKMLRGFLPASHPGRPPILRILVPVHSKPYFPASSPADPSVLLPAGPPVDFPAYFLLSIPVYHPVCLPVYLPFHTPFVISIFLLPFMAFHTLIVPQTVTYFCRRQSMSPTIIGDFPLKNNH